LGGGAAVLVALALQSWLQAWCRFASVRSAAVGPKCNQRTIDQYKFAIDTLLILSMKKIMLLCVGVQYL